MPLGHAYASHTIRPPSSFQPAAAADVMAMFAPAAAQLSCRCRQQLPLPLSAAAACHWSMDSEAAFSPQVMCKPHAVISCCRCLSRAPLPFTSAQRRLTRPATHHVMSHMPAKAKARHVLSAAFLACCPKFSSSFISQPLSLLSCWLLCACHVILQPA